MGLAGVYEERTATHPNYPIKITASSAKATQAKRYYPQFAEGSTLKVELTDSKYRIKGVSFEYDDGNRDGQDGHFSWKSNWVFVAGTNGVRGERMHVSWEYNTFTVTFNSNGGGAVSSQTVSYGNKASKPSDPSRVGYIFAGWYSDKELTKSYDFSSNTITSNITLYAKWTGITYAVSYELGNGGLYGDNHPETAVFGESVGISNPTRPGYNFAGWTSSEDDGLATDSARYNNGTAWAQWTGAAQTSETFMNLRKVADGEVKLTATWTPITYYISYNNEQGVVMGTSQPTETKFTETATITNPTRPGYIFLGWTSSADANLSTDSAQIGTTEALGNGWDGSTNKAEYFKNICTKSGQTITLTPQWQGITYHIAYDLGHGGVFGTVHPDTAVFGESVTISNPTRPGYNFAGWITSEGDGLSADSARYNNGTGWVIGWPGDAQTSETFMNLRKDSVGEVKLTATWTPITYTISYAYDQICDVKEAENAATYTATFATPIDIPNPTLEPYKFGGWVTNAEQGLSTDSAICGYTADYELKKWEGTMTRNQGFDKLCVKQDEVVKLTAIWRGSNITIDYLSDHYRGDVFEVNGQLYDECGVGLGNRTINLATTIGKLEEYEVETDSSGNFTFTVYCTTEGTENLTLRYNGDYNYPSHEITEGFIVKASRSSAMLSNTKGTLADDSTTVTTTLSDTTGVAISNTEGKYMIADANGNIVAGGDFKTDADGNLSLITDIKEAGTYTLTTSYTEEGKHGMVCVSATFTTISDGITEVKADASIAFPADVYDLSGRLVRRKAEDLSGLSAGIYIVNGKKIAITR